MVALIVLVLRNNYIFGGIMKKQNLMAGMCLSLATCFVAFASLLLPMILLMDSGMSGSSAGAVTLDGKSAFFMGAHGCVALFGLVFTIMSIISICKLGKDDEKVAKKKGLFIATIVIQGIVLVAGIIVAINAFQALAEFASAEKPEEVMQSIMLFGSSYITLIGAMIVHVVAFVVNLVSVIKLKKPVATVAEAK